MAHHLRVDTVAPRFVPRCVMISYAPKVRVLGTPPSRKTLARDWGKAAQYHARFGGTEAMSRRGVESIDVVGVRDWPERNPRT